MSKFSFKKISKNEAFKFWESSPQATAFTNPKILSYFNLKIDWWQSKKGEQPVAMWPINYDENKIVTIPDFFYYFGPIWFEDFHKIPNHSWLSLSKNVYEGFIKNFVLEYRNIHSQLPLGLNDVRIFDWWNYHEKENKRFLIKPKYSAVLDNLDRLSINDIKSNFRYWRRNELKKIEKNFNTIEKTNKFTAKEILEFYNKVTKNNKENTFSMIEGFLNLEKDKFGEIIAYRNKKNNKLISLIIMLFGKNEANLIISLIDENWKKEGLSVFSILESILSAKKKKLKLYDFNGANSPNRGDDKHSYGALPKLFFDIKYLEKN